MVQSVLLRIQLCLQALVESFQGHLAVDNGPNVIVLVGVVLPDLLQELLVSLYRFALRLNSFGLLLQDGQLLLLAGDFIQLATVLLPQPADLLFSGLDMHLVLIKV